MIFHFFLKKFLLMSCNKTPVFSVLYAKSIESSFGNTRTPFLPYGKRRRALPPGGRLPSACLSLPTFLPKNRVLQKKNRKDAHKKHFTRKTVPYTVSPFFRLQSRCPLRLFGFIFRLRCHLAVRTVREGNQNTPHKKQKFPVLIASEIEI